MRKIISAVIGAIALTTPFMASSPMLASAHADDCTGSWSIVAGGFQAGIGFNYLPSFWQDSYYLVGNAHVGYSSNDPASGVNEINNLFWDHRNQCPDDHIKIMGHSEGAGIVHAWVTDNQGVDNASAILLADPKRAAGPGGPGLSSVGGFLGWPLAGTDDYFGGFPVLTICNSDDQICDTDAGWFGYTFGGAHQRYDMNAFDYGDWDNGAVLN